MKKLTAILLTLCLLLSLTACGASTMDKASGAIRQEAAAEAPAEMEENSLTSGSTGSSTALPENRKWIITVDMHVETEDMDSLMAALDERITDLNGYVEDQSIHNGSSYSSRRYRNANLTVRIPAEQVDQFTEEVEGIANVTSNNLRREDITLTYVSTESRITALKTEQARLLELMAQAETMSDLLEIEERLTDVNYELESYTSQLRTYDNQINYATIYLFIEEVQEYTPVEEPTVWERITTGFRGSLKGLGNGLVDLVVWIIVCSPYLVVYGGIALVIFLIVKHSGKNRITKKAKEKKKPWQAPDANTEQDTK